MNDITPISQLELEKRRSVLRRQRRIEQAQAIWRTLAASCLLGGLIWGVNQPIWVVKEAKQITISGNKLLSKQAIQSYLPVAYPKSLLEIQPEELARALESQPTIADATVTRKLFPPRVTLQVQERVPVAVAITKNHVGTPTTGLVAEDGVWIPVQSYAAPNSTSFQMPKLKVLGQLEQYQPYWGELYQTLSQAQVKVTEIDCQNPHNLSLKTELGTVHLGPYSPLLVKQLQVLQQMSELPNKVPPSQVAYIDLSNPDNISVRTSSFKPKTQQN